MFVSFVLFLKQIACSLTANNKEYHYLKKKQKQKHISLAIYRLIDSLCLIRHFHSLPYCFATGNPKTLWLYPIYHFIILIWNVFTFTNKNIRNKDLSKGIKESFNFIKLSPVRLLFNFYKNSTDPLCDY